jgi:lysozyme family protein
MTFKDILSIILKAEGGYSDIAADHGGRTNYGVTQLTYDRYRSSINLDKRSVKYIEQPEVPLIYAKFYWKPCHCDELPDIVALVVFDCAVNSGSVRAIETLQRCVGTKQDGIIGPKTLAAVLAADPQDLANLFLDERIRFYHAIVAHDSSQSIFLKGWLNRIANLKEKIRQVI